MQPGEIIQPGTSGSAPAPSPPPAQAPPEPPAAPEPPAPQPPAPEPVAPESQWQFTAENASPAPTLPGNIPQDEVSWTASEYIAHHKTMGWFVGLGLVIALIAGGIYLITHDFVAMGTIIVVGGVFGAFAARQPDVISYLISDRGIQMAQKFYSFDNFKSFAVMEEGAVQSIILNPLKRLMPPIAMYFEATDEDKILAALSDFLPFEEATKDPVERLMRRIRF